MYKLILILIITLFAPMLVLAHGGHDEIRAQWEQKAGVLPGEVYYFIDRAGEWIETNLMILSTKEKQKKWLAASDERLYELAMLADLSEHLEIIKDSAMRRAADLYSKEVNVARDIAQKIIFLDGAEIAIAEEFERKTFEQELLLAGLFEELDPRAEGFVQEALIAARVNNREIFEYMVINYQFTDEDIMKHQEILDRHIGWAEQLSEDIDDEERLQKIESAFLEARKFREAGLNVQAYQWIDRAKNILY